MAGRPSLCHGCGTPLWGDAGPPAPSPGSDVVDVTYTGCGSGSSVFALTADPATAARDPAEVRQDLEMGRQLRLHEDREALAGAAFTAYGLSAGWSGRRWINGWGIGVVDAGALVTLKVLGLSPEQCRLVEITDYTPFVTYRPLLG